MVPDEEISEVEKLEEEIAALKSRIKNTEYDLMNMFKGNALLGEKLKNSKATLDEKQSLLEKLKKDPKKAETIEEFEDNVTDKTSTTVSEAQEDIMKDEIEKQFI